MKETLSGEVSLADAAPVVAACVKAGLPCFLWGKPGVGKSRMAEQLLRQLGFECRTLIASTLNPVDLRGVPTIVADGTSHFCPPDWWRIGDGEKVAFFFDELNAALPSVQAAFYRVILEGRLDGINIASCPRIAAGNRLSDKGVVFRLPTPLANRFVHIQVRECAQAWLNWAYGSHDFSFKLPALRNVPAEASIHPMVTAFIGWKREGALCAFNPKSDEIAFPTPRTWEYASRLMHTGLEGEPLFTALAGTIGVGAATEFFGFLKWKDKLPDPNDILDGKTTSVPEEVSALYALSGALAPVFAARWGKEPREELSSRLLDYSLKVSETTSEEFGVIIVRAAIAQTKILPSRLFFFPLDYPDERKRGSWTEAGRRWYAKHGPVLGVDTEEKK